MTGVNHPRVLVADPLGPDGLDLLREHAEVVLASDPAHLRASLPTSDALIVRSQTKVTADLLGQGPHLRIVGRAGIGVDNIDVPAATAQGILVVNAPLGNVRSTAEHTIALLFALARRLVAADAAVRDGTWKTGYQGVQVSGKRLGVIGAGKVGGMVASLASALGMEVVVHDPYLADEARAALRFAVLPLADVLSTSDFVTIHVPLLAGTRNLLGAEQMGSMKRGAYLINCARGGLVDEEALAIALHEGRLGGAALDVFSSEPLRQSPLLAAPNVIVTPHVAASTREAQAQVSVDVAVQVLDFFAGKPVAYAINPDVVRKASSE